MSVHIFRSVKYSFFRIYSKWQVLKILSLSFLLGMMWFQIEPTERQISNRQGVVSFNSLFNSEFTINIHKGYGSTI